MSVLSIVAVALGAIFSENIVFGHNIGVVPFLSKTDDVKTTLITGAEITVVTGVCAFVTSVFEYVLLRPLDLTYLRSVAYIGVIALCVALVSVLVKKYGNKLKKLTLSLPAIYSNTAVLGVCVFAAKTGYNILESLVWGIFAGAGFTLSALLFLAVRLRLKYSKIPDFFEGMPIILITAGLVALAFTGFIGMKFI